MRQVTELTQDKLPAHPCLHCCSPLSKISAVRSAVTMCSTSEDVAKHITASIVDEAEYRQATASRSLRVISAQSDEDTHVRTGKMYCGTISQTAMALQAHVSMGMGNGCHSSSVPEGYPEHPDALARERPLVMQSLEHRCSGDDVGPPARLLDRKLDICIETTGIYTCRGVDKEVPEDAGEPCESSVQPRMRTWTKVWSLTVAEQLRRAEHEDCDGRVEGLPIEQRVHGDNFGCGRGDGGRRTPWAGNQEIVEKSGC